MAGSDHKKSVAELIERCKAVGWSVVKSGSDHFKVDTRRGIMIIPSTPGSDRSYQNTLAQAKRYGLEELEARLLNTQERARQGRIAEDRRRNEAKLAALQAANGQREAAPTVAPRSERKEDDDPTVDTGLGRVNGIGIREIAPATIKTPVMSKPAPLANAEELLLANGTVVYRCTKTGAATSVSTTRDDQLCHAVFSTPGSLRTHIGFHTTRKLRDAAVEIERATQSTDREDEKEVKATPTQQPKAIAANTVIDADANVTVDKLKIELTSALASLVETVDKIGSATIEARNSLLKLVDLIQHMKAEVIVQEPDPELVAKAAQFDALAGTLRGLIK